MISQSARFCIDSFYFIKILAICSPDFKIVAAFNKTRTSVGIPYFLAYFNQINFPLFYFFFSFV